MADCCSPDSERYRDVFDPRFAARVARRYRTRGPSTTGRRIVDFVAAHGLDGSTVLEVGGGVGELQLELLARGAERTVNLELSAGYEDEAARLIAERGMHGRVTRTTGIDLANQPERVPVADIVILHRVVCCYDDAERLLAAAADHARRLVAFSGLFDASLRRGLCLLLGGCWLGHGLRFPSRPRDPVASAPRGPRP